MSNSKIATPYKTNELDMVTLKKLKNRGVNFNSRRGRSTKPKNNEKSIGFSLPIWRSILRWKFLSFFNHFSFLGRFTKVVESKFLGGSNIFAWRSRKVVPELTLSRLGCRHSEKAYKKHWEFPFRFCDVNISREVSKKKTEARMAAPTKAQFEACREPPLRRAKNVGKNLTFSDLNDPFPWRE